MLLIAENFNNPCATRIYVLVSTMTSDYRPTLSAKSNSQPNENWGKKSHLPNWSLRSSHPILYRARADSGRKHPLVLWFTPQQWKRRCSEPGWVAGKNRVGQGRCAESRPGCGRESITYRSRAGGGAAHHAVTAADTGHGFWARPRWPQLPLGHRPKQGAGVAKGAPRGEARGSEQCPKPGLKREESKPHVSQDFGKALPRPWVAWREGHQASRELEEGRETPSLHGRTLELAQIHAEGQT